MQLSVFFRNDDVKGELDESLIYLSERLLEMGILLLHAVEPKNVSKEVVEWLVGLKKDHPETLSIIQHGLDHAVKTSSPNRGEFGGGRSFESQLSEIQQGKQLMEKYFGGFWNQVFSFPYGSYDMNTLCALALEGYQGISTGIRLTRKRHVFNTVGRFLKIKRLVGQNIVYFNEQVPGFPLMEYPVVLNTTKKYTQPDSGVQKNLSELIHDWHCLPRFVRYRGILTHHRFNTLEDIDELTDFVTYLRSINTKFLSLQELFRD